MSGMSFLDRIRGKDHWKLVDIPVNDFLLFKLKKYFSVCIILHRGKYYFSVSIIFFVVISKSAIANQSFIDKVTPSVVFPTLDMKDAICVGLRMKCAF